MLYKWPEVFDITMRPPNETTGAASINTDNSVSTQSVQGEEGAKRYQNMAMTSFNLRYASSLFSYAYFRDGTPADAILDMQFVSIIPHFKTKDV